MMNVQAQIEVDVFDILYFWTRFSDGQGYLDLKPVGIYLRLICGSYTILDLGLALKKSFVSTHIAADTEEKQICLEDIINVDLLNPVSLCNLSQTTSLDISVFICKMTGSLHAKSF